MGLPQLFIIKFYRYTYTAHTVFFIAATRHLVDLSHYTQHNKLR